VSDPNIEIRPNRQQVNDKFPVVGFTVKTGGLPYFEVIVTIDKQLFAPDKAAARNASNFFSSHQPGNQLQNANSNDSVYIVPAAVLNSFAQNNPKPSAIYYTLIAYPDQSGSGGVYAHSIETLLTSAPSISLAPDFTGQTLSKVLGINADSLRRVETHAAAYMPAYQSRANQLSRAAAAAETDEGEAEDGFSLLNSQSGAQAFENGDEGAAYAEDGYEYERQEDYSAQESYAAPDDDYSSSGYRSMSSYEANGDDDYQDGFEEELGYVQERTARMQESIFPEGASEPNALYDEESEFYGDESLSNYEDDYAAQPLSAKDDSSYEYAGAPSGFSRNGFNYKNNGHAHQPPPEEDFSAGQEFDSEEDYGEDYGESYASQNAAARRESAPARAADTGEDGTVIAAERRIRARKKIIETIAKFESGGGRNPYKAINADTEFASLKWHEAYQRYHIGLSYGLVQFTQDGGSLGKLLSMMRERDKAAFDRIFGNGDANRAQRLIDVTNAAGASSSAVKGGRSARVQPVDGADLWVTPWRERFEAAGDHVPFQSAQNELASTEYLDPILQFCEWLGLNTDRAVAMVYDRSVQMGVGGAKKWVIGAVGPVSTSALQLEALKALGKKDIKAFQQDFSELDADGKWGAMTHAAMVSALRALGTGSPIPIPTREQMMDAMLRGAAGKSWEHRVKDLRNSGAFSDAVFPF
jgi:hypothetical protein